MSAASRCHEYEHKRGHRNLAINKTSGPRGKRPVGLQKKAPCNCDCHS